MKIGFIGCGSMASAMIGGILKKELCTPLEITASARTEDTLDKAKEKYGIVTTLSNVEVVENSDVVILAVKPQYYEKIIDEIQDSATKDQIFVSIAPGKDLRWLADQFGSSEYKIARTMPNTPAMVSEGITGISPGESMEDRDVQTVLHIFNSFGKAELIPESLMDVVTAVSGSSPAYVFMFIEAMADAAVADGMPRKQAYTFAAQSVLGSAKMVLETGKHPGELKDMVCSPGGTTIEAVRVLEEKGFRSAVIEAMKACTRKARGEN